MRRPNLTTAALFAMMATMSAGCLATYPLDEESMALELDGESAHAEFIGGDDSGQPDPDPGKAKLQVCNELLNSTGEGSPFAVQCGPLTFDVDSGECGECQHVMAGDLSCDLYLNGAVPLVQFDLWLEDQQALALVVGSEPSGEVVLDEELPTCIPPDGSVQ